MLMVLLAFVMTSYGNKLPKIMEENDGTPYTKPNCDVYVAGYQSGRATIWENGNIINLPSNGTSFAHSVYVADGNVYVAGTENNGQWIAKLWKNGVAQNLSDGTRYAMATSVHVLGDDIYVAGYEDLQGGRDAMVWKNGVAQKLTYGSWVEALSIFVSSDDVYVVGFEYNSFTTAIAKFWKNGVVQNLTDGTFLAQAHSVFADGNDIYIAGYEGDSPIILKTTNPVGTIESNLYRSTALKTGVAKLWKNGVVQDLTDGTREACAYSVYVYGNDVYVAGFEFNAQNTHVAKYWKNGVAQDLTDGTNNAHAHSIYVSNNDVYVVGFEYNAQHEKVAKLWKNGVAQNLTDGTLTAQAYSVFVARQYTVSVSANPEEGGEVMGGGIYNEGANIAVNATPNTGYNFVNWTKSGIEISTENPYSFTVTEDVALVANFEEKIGIENIEIAAVKIYPNPTTGKLRIESGELRIEKIEIFDIYGRTQKTESRKQKGKILMEISELPVGVYFLRIITEQGEVVRKVLKE